MVKILEVINWKVKKMTLVPVLWVKDEKGCKEVTCTEVEDEVYSFTFHRKTYYVNEKCQLIDKPQHEN